MLAAEIAVAAVVVADGRLERRWQPPEPSPHSGQQLRLRHYGHRHRLHLSFAVVRLLEALRRRQRRGWRWQ